MNNNKQCAYWFLTIHENAKSYENIENILNDLVEDNPNIEYSYIYHDIDEDDNVKHIHLVIYFKGKVKRFSTIQNIFDGAHIEQTNQQRYKRCIQYLIHKNDENKKQYQPSEIITNIDIVSLNDIITGNGYDFELFQEEKLFDYMNEFYDEYKEISMDLFVKRFGLSAIQKNYFVIKDLVKDFIKNLVRAESRFKRLSPIEKAFNNYIGDDINLKCEYKIAVARYGFKGDFSEYKMELYNNFVDTCEENPNYIDLYLNKEDN